MPIVLMSRGLQKNSWNGRQLLYISCEFENSIWMLRYTIRLIQFILRCRQQPDIKLGVFCSLLNMNCLFYFTVFEYLCSGGFKRISVLHLNGFLLCVDTAFGSKTLVFLKICWSSSSELKKSYCRCFQNIFGREIRCSFQKFFFYLSKLVCSWLYTIFFF